MDKRFENKAALVTGGSRGIGKAIVRRLAEEGAQVLFTGRNGETIRKTKEEFQDEGLKVDGIAADVANPESAAATVSHCIDTFGKIDILVNNAGISKDALAIRMKDSDWDDVLNINLKGAFSFCRAVAKPMMKARYGRIINISSVIGLMGNPGQVNYAAAKAGMIGMSKSLAKELAPRGITVNAVAPGFIETDMTSGMKEEMLEKVVSSIPLGRIGKAEDIAAMTAFLASDEASYITGKVFAVDGGLVM